MNSLRLNAASRLFAALLAFAAVSSVVACARDLPPQNAEQPFDTDLTH
jgi:hypothetical protein